MLLPFALAPFEKLLPDLPARYEAYTFADIHAPADKIWANVVRVRTIPEQADHGTLTRFLGFPRPIRAELDYAGVGGSRQAIFSKGLVFKEVVLEYTDQKKMHFSITANPHDIPSTTMDKHVVIGGDYFNVLDGTYELERLSDSVYRLHLYSHFTLRTTFNFYASWWAGWIMKDIQNNILQVIRTRSEAKLLYPGMSLSTKKTLVLGASSNPERYSYLAVRRLRNAGHPVSAIGRKAATLGDVEISVDRGAIDDLDTVTLYLNPVNQKEYYDYILSLHPRRIIFNPGAENPELEALAFANGIEPVEACTLVLLSTGQY
jgi:predicted CoA-binding protein